MIVNKGEDSKRARVSVMRSLFDELFPNEITDSFRAVSVAALAYQSVELVEQRSLH